MTAGDRPDPVRQAVGSTGQSADPGTAGQLSELARQMQADTTSEALLQRIVVAAVSEVPGAQHAGITLVTGKKVATPAATSDLAGVQAFGLLVTSSQATNRKLRDIARHLVTTGALPAPPSRHSRG